MDHPDYEHGWYSTDPVSSAMRMAVRQLERQDKAVRRGLKKVHGWDDARIDAALERRR